MKKLFTLLMLCFSVSFFSCGGDDGDNIDKEKLTKEYMKLIDEISDLCLEIDRWTRYATSGSVENYHKIMETYVKPMREEMKELEKKEFKLRKILNMKIEGKEDDDPSPFCDL